MLTDAELADWQRLLGVAEEQTSKCMADPEWANARGIAPIYDRVRNSASLPGAPMAFNMPADTSPLNDKAAWLRGVAKHLIPDAFAWTVQETVGGGAFLVLLGVNKEPVAQ